MLLSSRKAPAFRTGAPKAMPPASHDGRFTFSRATVVRSVRRQHSRPAERKRTLLIFQGKQVPVRAESIPSRETMPPRVGGVGRWTYRVPF